MSNTKKVWVFNTFTKKFEKVEVSTEIADVYNRTEWAEDYNDEKFFNNEIQFSQLKGGTNNAFENFDEFVSSEKDLQDYLDKQELLRKLNKELVKLSKRDLEIINYLFFEKLSQEECGEILGVTQQRVSYRKKQILKKILKNLL